MCMFSRHVEHVAATKIFARGLPDGRQVLVYAMDVAVADELAMILPLPVPAGCADDAVEFVDLEGYSELFGSLERAFPAAATMGFGAAKRGGPRLPEIKLIPVHTVGAFEASFVPRQADFERLDPRFRLPPEVFAALPQYADWAFAVFQLRKPGWFRKRASVHPMALRFPRRDRDAVFFPTVHVHDGTVPAHAAFDHTLYAQLPPVIGALTNWSESLGALGGYVDATRAGGLIDDAAGGWCTTLFGPLPNQDLWLRSPAGVVASDLEGSGSSYAYRVRATYHFASRAPDKYPAWLETAANKLPRLCAGIRAGLAALCSEHARAWQLAVLSDALPPHFMNGDQLWRGTSYRDGTSQLVGGPGRVAFRPFSQLIEPQDITLGFSEIPTVDEAREINRALCAMLDRTLA